MHPFLTPDVVKKLSESVPALRMVRCNMLIVIEPICITGMMKR